MNSINWPAPSIWVFIAQLGEHCSANAEATGSNPVEAPKNIFSGYFRNCLNCDSLRWSHTHFIRSFPYWQPFCTTTNFFLLAWSRDKSYKEPIVFRTTLTWTIKLETPFNTKMFFNGFICISNGLRSFQQIWRLLMPALLSRVTSCDCLPPPPCHSLRPRPLVSVFKSFSVHM